MHLGNPQLQGVGAGKGDHQLVAIIAVFSHACWVGSLHNEHSLADFSAGDWEQR